MYNNGKQINEKLFTEIQDLEKKVFIHPNFVA